MLLNKVYGEVVEMGVTRSPPRDNLVRLSPRLALIDRHHAPMLGLAHRQIRAHSGEGGAFDNGAHQPSPPCPNCSPMNVALGSTDC